MKIFVVNKHLNALCLHIADMCKEKYGDDVTILNEHHFPMNKPDELDDKHFKIYLCGESIKLIAEADIVLFDSGYRNSKEAIMLKNFCLEHDIVCKYIKPFYYYDKKRCRVRWFIT